MNFNIQYNKNLKPLYGNRENDFEIFFINLIRYLKYFKIFDINKETKILDLGSADNSFEKIVKKKFDIDLDSFNNPNCNFENDLINIKDQFYDVIIFKAVIEHIRNPNNILHNIKRSLKKDGILIITTSNHNYQIKEFWNDPTHVHPYNPVSLKKLLDIFEFRNVSVRPFAFRKPSFYWKLPFWFISKIPFKNHTFNNFPIPGILRGHSTVMIATAIK